MAMSALSRATTIDARARAVARTSVLNVES